MAPWETMNKRAGTGSGLPMPLWLQGAMESAAAAVVSALLVIVPLVGVWWADGFADKSLATLARLAGQAWLVIHAVPLHLTLNEGPSSATLQSGTLTLIPLGLTLI